MSSNLWLLSAIAIVLVCGCGKSAKQSATPTRGSTQTDRVQRGVWYLFAEELPTTDVGEPISKLDFAAPDAPRYLTSGWHSPEKNDKGESFAWTEGRNGVVDLTRVDAEDLTVTLRVSPAGLVPTLPQQDLRIAWNGHDLGSFPLPRRLAPLTFKVPAGLQSAGQNRLELMSNYWLNPRAMGQGTEDRTLGAQCFGIDFLEEGPQFRPADPPVAPFEGGFVQTGATALTFAFPFPQNAALRGEGELRFDDVATTVPLRGKVSVEVHPASGPARALFSRDLAALLRDPHFKLDADLSDLAGSMGSITLAFSLKTPVGDGRLKLVWKNLGLEGNEEQINARGLEKLRGKYNVLLVAFDTLRADHTEPYGATNVKTPELLKLAAAGATFMQARSVAAWTRPSVVSFLTSTYCTRNGVSTYSDQLPPDLPYLPELLQNAGYKTLAVLNNPQIPIAAGFGRGFNKVHEYWREHEAKMQRDYHAPEDQADYVWGQFVAPHLKRSEDSPFFIYIHEIDPHAPYTPMEPFGSMYDFGYRGALDTGMFFDERTVSREVTRLADADVRFLNSKYRGEITYMDRYLGALMEKLRDKKLDKKTLVIFLSDHGEQFMEHGELGHRLTVWEQLLRVPFIVSLPGVIPEGRKLQTPAELIDLPPTVLDLLGQPIPPQMQGRSLLPAMLLPEESHHDRAVFAQSYARGLDSVQHGPWKLIRHNLAEAGGWPSGYELYNIERDPGETDDRWAAEPLVGSVLRHLLRRQHLEDRKIHAGTAAGPLILDAETIRILKALGYL